MSLDISVPIHPREDILRNPPHVWGQQRWSVVSIHILPKPWALAVDLFNLFNLFVLDSYLKCRWIGIDDEWEWDCHQPLLGLSNPNAQINLCQQAFSVQSTELISLNWWPILNVPFSHAANPQGAERNRCYRVSTAGVRRNAQGGWVWPVGQVTGGYHQEWSRVFTFSAVVTWVKLQSCEELCSLSFSIFWGFRGLFPTIEADSPLETNRGNRKFPHLVQWFPQF